MREEKEDNIAILIIIIITIKFFKVLHFQHLYVDRDKGKIINTIPTLLPSVGKVHLDYYNDNNDTNITAVTTIIIISTAIISYSADKNLTILIKKY